MDTQIPSPIATTQKSQSHKLVKDLDKAKSPIEAIKNGPKPRLGLKRPRVESCFPCDTLIKGDPHTEGFGECKYALEPKDDLKTFEYIKASTSNAKGKIKIDVSVVVNDGSLN